MSPVIADVVAALDEAFPFAWAEPWDNVGLALGDPAAVVRGVLVTLDPTLDAVRRAASTGANVLVSHHPAYLEPPARIVAGPGAAGVMFEALSRGVALVACHTNLDRAPAGSDALPLALGLRIDDALEHELQPVCSVTTFVPTALANGVFEAGATAGAGRIGEYEACGFETAGQGRFRPRRHADPAVGTSGEDVRADEVRLEMVCPPHAATRVAEAIRAAHPYEEPLVVIADATIMRTGARMGRVCAPLQPMSLSELASLVAERFGVMPRVYGDRSRPVERIATANGSGRALVQAAVDAKCDALITGELRYHEALEAAASGLAVIEAGHDMTEWPMVPLLARVVQHVPGISENAVTVDAPAAAWWTP